MRVLALFLVLAELALPGYAARRSTVEQLEQMLARSQGRPDAEVARQLGELELSERLSSPRLLELKADLPGEKSRQALVVLADTSAFLNPPAAEIPGTATPDLAAQRHMMALTVDYIGKSLPLLPNLFATRDTARFESLPEPVGVALDASALRAVSRSSVTVLYRDNREFVDTGIKRSDKSQPPDKGLTTWGEFGPILAIVMIDAAHSKLAWSHWELGPGGPQAVFRYAVPKEKSHYDIRFCCVASAYGMESDEARQRAGYHGEITVDPSSGAILRITLEADLDPGNLIARASLAVEYGTVEIGSRSYICPVRGVALGMAPDAKALRSALYSQGVTGGPPPLQKASISAVPSLPEQTLLNDISFRQYHLFRAEARVVTGDTETASSAAHLNGAATTSGTTSVPASETANQPAGTEQPADSSTAASPAPVETAAAEAPPAPIAAPEPVIPEVSIADARGLPETSARAQQTAPESGFTLHISSHLVDIGVVALDKKGRPVTNLKPEDFEIYDNGVKQEVRSFEQAASATAPEPAAASAAPTDRPEFSNRPVVPANPGKGEENTIVLLMDGSNLAFPDLANAREQTVRFVRALPDSQRVALYAMEKYGFEVLVEGSSDHEAIAARLAKWMPSAQDLSEAQFNEARNRQQIETVHNPEDLLSVNGNSGILDPEIQTEALDPKLRTLGSSPPRNALSILVDVARHLAAISGHKSLVWVTSDNALADWDQSSTSIEKTSKYIEPAALRVQEAMNNAHVSVYPLDASHLEGNVIEADIGRRNVELTPTFQRPPAYEGQFQGPEETAGQDQNPYDMGRDMRPGRLTAQMQQDLHGIQGVFREVAAATGGQALRRSNNIVGQLNGVVNDGRATYLLDFAPSEAADGKYHLLTVKVVNRKDVALRYRAGFQYDVEPSTVKERFTKAVWQPSDMTDVTLSATPSPTDATTLKLNIAATDLALAQQGNLWTDKVDIFLVRRNDSTLKAQVTGQAMNLLLKPETYQKFLREGIPFDQIVEAKAGTSSIRIVVLDENSGRMGTVTIPAETLLAKR
jgi:VWFA-related protein